MLYKFRWIIAGFVTAVVVALFGGLAWFFMANSPVDPKAKPVSYQLEPGTSVGDIANQLQNRKIIKSASAFKIVVTVKGLRSQLKAGSYELSPSQSTSAIASQLADGRIATNKLVVPEGADIAKIRELAGNKGVSVAEFNKALQASYANKYLAARPAGHTSLEGYLFPDSYEIAKSPQAQPVVQLMLDTFSQRLEKANLVELFAAQGLSVHEGLTLASIVEKEVSRPADRPMVAGVFYNRLKIGQRLETDPTIEYAAKLTGKPFSLSLDSPYNTYRNYGLPPGPICSPGVSAMEAVSHPQKHDYFYFLSDKQGKTHFSKTLDEHTANIKRYLSN